MKYRKKPVTIDAVQWNGFNLEQVLTLADAVPYERPLSLDVDDAHVLLIPTLEGTMRTHCGDWVIRGVNGELYPCKPDIFEKTYEAVE